MSTTDNNPVPADDPGYASVRKFLLYTLSHSGADAAERGGRGGGRGAGVGLAAGAAGVPGLDHVPRDGPPDARSAVPRRGRRKVRARDRGGPQPQVENFVARKAVGNFVEMAGMATLHVSPLTLLAIVSDVAYGSQAYLKELADELKKQGVIDEQSTIHHVDDLLAAVADASKTTAQAFDTPPISVEGLKQTIDETRAAIAGIDPTKVIPQAEMQKLWDEMHALATQEGVGILEISGAATLRMLEKAGTLSRGASPASRWPASCWTGTC